MGHNDNSKIEVIHIKIPKELNDLLLLLSDKDPKSDFCRTKVAYNFMIYGIFEAFTSQFHWDLDNKEWALKNLQEIEKHMPWLINKVNLNTNERREKQDAKK